MAGGKEAALAKLRLLLKTDARIDVFATDAAPEIQDWAQAKKLNLIKAPIQARDAAGAALVYCATEDPREDAGIAALARAAGALVNIVDNLEDSDFITPAIVDRAPVTVAIGTEGAAPVLARAIKADIEERLPNSLGQLARVGKSFRPKADALPFGRKRRAFWSDFYFNHGPAAQNSGGTAAVERTLDQLLQTHLGDAPSIGHIDFVGAGSGEPEHLTLKAREALHAADVVIYDRTIPLAVLELARREADLFASHGVAPHTAAREHAQNGLHVVRLSAGDGLTSPTITAEIDAARKADLDVREIAGISPTTAPAPQPKGLVTVLSGPNASAPTQFSNTITLKKPLTKEQKEHAL